MYRIIEKNGIRSSHVVGSAEGVASYLLGRVISDYIILKNDTTFVHLTSGEYTAMVNACAATSTKLESAARRIEVLERRAIQGGLNVMWLIDKIDKIHTALCPNQLGTWQERAGQAVTAATLLSREKKKC